MEQEVYKVVDRDNRGFGGLEWGRGVTRRAEGNPICRTLITGPDGIVPPLLWAYGSPAVAGFLHHVHTPHLEGPKRLWRARGEVALTDCMQAAGSTCLTTIEEVPLPDIPVEAMVRVAIYLAKLRPCDLEWHRWADGWLSGQNRSEQDARRAAQTTGHEMRQLYGELAWKSRPYRYALGPGREAYFGAARPAAAAAASHAMIALTADALSGCAAGLARFVPVGDYFDKARQQQAARYDRDARYASTYAAFGALAFRQVEKNHIMEFWQRAIESAPDGSSRQQREADAHWAERALSGFSLDSIVRMATADEVALRW